MTATLNRTGLAFTADRSAFASAVTWAAKRVSSRPTIPAHGGILLSVANGTLTAAGYNENASATARCDVEGATDGQVLVSGRLLADLLGTLPDRPISAAMEASSLALTCGRAKVTLPLMPNEDFPALPEMPPTIGEVDAALFAQAVKLVGASCDVSGERSIPAFTGINLKFGEALTIEATDRYRGAYAEIPWRACRTGVPTALPFGAELLSVTADLANDVDGVTVGAEPGLFGLASRDRSVVIRQLGDPYHPNLRGILTNPSDDPCRIAVADLKPELDRLRLMASAKDRPSALLRFGADVVHIAGSGQDATAAEEIACAYTGESRELTLGVRFVLAALAVAGGAEVDLHFGGLKQPFIVTPVGAPFEYRQFVTPMRTGS